MNLKSLLVIPLVSIFLLSGCGGAGSPQLVEPTFTVNFPERNRSVINVNEMVESISIFLYRPNTNEILYGPFRARRIGSPSSAHSQTFSLPPVAIGTYRFVVGGWDQANEEGEIAGSDNSLIRITPEATITRADGTPYVATLIRTPNISLVRINPNLSEFKVGSFSSALTMGKLDLGDTFEIPNAWLRFTWIEGREKLEIAGEVPGGLSYRAISPGVVRFKVSLQDFTSSELVLNIKP